MSAAAIVLAETPEEVKWFDMESCAFCKHLATDPALMDNMTWETHGISNGIVVITAVKPEYQKSYKAACKAMTDLTKQMEAGEVKAEDIKMCGHCQHYGKMVEAGAKIEDVMGKVADVTIITSDKPETLAMIKEYAKRNNEEMAKMEAEKKAE